MKRFFKRKQQKNKGSVTNFSHFSRTAYVHTYFNPELCSVLVPLPFGNAFLTSNAYICRIDTYIPTCIVILSSLRTETSFRINI
jgi:hypothetical protein